MFDTLSVMGGSPSDVVCSAIQKLRETPGEVTALKTIREEKALTPTRLNQLGQALDIDLNYGGSVTVTAGVNRFETTVGSGWPCAPTTSTSCRGLFCSSYDCEDPLARGYANYRLWRAVLAAKQTTWQANDNDVAIAVPAYINDNFESAKSNYNQEILRVGAWSIGGTQNDQWRVFFGEDIDSITPGDVARIAFAGPSGNYDVVGPDVNNYRFAFQTFSFPARTLYDLRDTIWGGLWTGMGDGYAPGLLSGAIPLGWDLERYLDSQVISDTLPASVGTIIKTNTLSCSCPSGQERPYVVWRCGSPPQELGTDSPTRCRN